MQLNSSAVPSHRLTQPQPQPTDSFAAQALMQLLHKAAEAASLASNQDDTEQPLQPLRTGNKRWVNQANENRKAAAAQKVARLKDLVKALKQMMMLASPDDAAAMMRRLKLIAGQLKSAVAQYAQAGGSSSGGNTGGLNATPANPQDTTKTTAPPVPSAPTDSTELQPASAADTTHTTATEHDTKHGAHNTPNPATALSAANTEDKEAEYASKKRDEQLLDDVAYIKNAIKQMARMAARKMRQDGRLVQDLQDIMKQLKAVDQLASDIRSNQSTNLLATRVDTIQAAYSANLTTGAIGAVQVNIAAPVVNVAT